MEVSQKIVILKFNTFSETCQNNLGSVSTYFTYIRLSSKNIRTSLIIYLSYRMLLQFTSLLLKYIMFYILVKEMKMELFPSLHF